jgi:hypothetical protein
MNRRRLSGWLAAALMLGLGGTGLPALAAEVEPIVAVIDAVDRAGRRITCRGVTYALSSTVQIGWARMPGRLSLRDVPAGTRAELYPESDPGEIPVVLKRIVLLTD